MSYPKWPAEVELRRRNRKVLAERLRWPDGALQACAELEGRHPGWHVSWMMANPHRGFERPAGFLATGESADGMHSAEVFGATVEELEPLMDIPDHEFYPKVCWYCLGGARRQLRWGR